MDHIDQPRRLDAGALRRNGQWVSAEAETPRNRRNYGVPGTRISYQPMGLRLTGPDLAKLSDKRVGIIGTGATAI